MNVHVNKHLTFWKSVLVGDSLATKHEKLGNWAYPTGKFSVPKISHLVMHN